MTIDPGKLPGRALIDSGVLTRWLDDVDPDDNTQICKDFVDAMLANERDILVAAPSISEVIRKDGKRQVPRTRYIEVVGFDLVAAEILGRQLPMDVLKEVKGATGNTLTHLKYDAMIVACAVRYLAECVVALDEDYPALCQHVGLAVYHPKAFEHAQGSLALPTVPPVPPST